MTLEDSLIDIDTSLGFVNPTHKQSRLKDMKEAVISELRSAHFLIYHPRIERQVQALLKGETKEDIALKKKEEENSLIIISKKEIYLENSKEKIQYFVSGNSEKIKTMLAKTSSRDLVNNLTANAVEQDLGFFKFKERIDKLESEGDESKLESLLNAAHNVSIVVPYYTQEFLSTIKALDQDSIVPYSKLVSNLFKANSPPTIIPSQLNLIPQPYIKRLLIDEDMSENKCKSNKIGTIYRKDNDVYSIENLEALFGKRRTSLVHERLTYKFPKIKDLKMQNVDASFFSEFEAINRKLNGGDVRKFLDQANVFFEQDELIGREFALKSRPTLVSYIRDLGWSFEEFVEDYTNFGKNIFNVALLVDKFAGIGNEREKLLRDIIDNKDTEKLESLNRISLSSSNIQLIREKLPNDVSLDEIIRRIQDTEKLYVQCNQNHVDSRLVTSRLNRIERTETLNDYLKSLERISKTTNQYIEFVKEQKRDPNMNLGFNDNLAQSALELYEMYLGRDFSQYKRDFTGTGTDFQRLPEIKNKYAKFLEEEKLKAMVGYVGKQKSRDLIKDLLMTRTPDCLTKEVIDKLGKNGSKRELVKAISYLNRTYSFLCELDIEILAHIETQYFSREYEDLEKQGFLRRLISRNKRSYQNIHHKVGAEGIVEEALSKVNSDCNSEDINQALNGIKKIVYTTLTGGLEVPIELEEKVNNIVHAYYKRNAAQKEDIQPALEFITKNYLKYGAEKTFNEIRGLKPNKKLRARMIKRGVDIDAFEKGISKTYSVGTDNESLSRLREKINAEIEQVYDRLNQLGLEEKQLEELQEGNLREQLESLDKFLGEYEFTEETELLKLEIKGHIQTARSITGNIKEMVTEARFYVSNDPFESLHMGQYFGTCLSLSKNHGGINGWASVVQTMDSNKNVIYAKAEDGKYLGRNRTALTNKGILCTRFHQNGNMNLNDAWIDYLKSFAEYTKQDVMIPTKFTPSSMAQILENKVAAGEASKESRVVKIEPAYFSSFYGDGLATEKLFGGNIKIEEEVYVLKPKNHSASQIVEI